MIEYKLGRGGGGQMVLGKGSSRSVLGAGASQNFGGESNIFKE